MVTLEHLRTLFQIKKLLKSLKIFFISFLFSNSNEKNKNSNFKTKKIGYLWKFYKKSGFWYISHHWWWNFFFFKKIKFKKITNILNKWWSPQSNLIAILQMNDEFKGRLDFYNDFLWNSKNRTKKTLFSIWSGFPRN